MSKEHLTREEVRRRYLALEQQGLFDQHVDPIDYSIVIPVTKDYHYYPVGLRETLSRSFRYEFVVKPLMRKVNRRYLETTVVGQENLRGLSRAMVVSNHIHMFDCMALKKAMKGHYLNIVAASFNNFKGFLGDGMRASGMLPLPASLDGMKGFENAIALSFKKKSSYLHTREEFRRVLNHSRIMTMPPYRVAISKAFREASAFLRICRFQG
jgi:1-acyl-sn-glycerol-3-phosphate acyltransferase